MSTARPAAAPPVVRIVVVGDLAADVVLAPDRPLERGTDVAGRVTVSQGGSAANTAGWVARLGASSSLVCSVGTDALGRSLVADMAARGVTVRAIRIASARTDRIGVLVAPDGERSFVADRGAAQELRLERLRAAWFARADVLHVPAYSLLGEPLGRAGLAAIAMARAAGARISVDLASAAPLLAGGRGAALDLLRAAAPDVLLANESEVARLLGDGGRSDYATEAHTAALLALAPAVVVKRGARGARVLERAGGSVTDVATRPLLAPDTTGAGDAFDAGFLVGWVGAIRAGLPAAAALRRGAAAGNRAAGRHLAAPRRELALG